MVDKNKEDGHNWTHPFPVPSYRFDQKNEVFKRASWDKKLKSNAQSFNNDFTYKDEAGYQKLDYMLRNASWNLEWDFGFGNSKSNSGLYSWDRIPDKLRPYMEKGELVKGSPKEMSHIVKKVGSFLGASLVGVTNVHPNWIYSNEFNQFTEEHYPIDLPKECQNAVVMAVEMDYDAILSSPSGIAGAATGLGYSKMAYLANMIAVFIRGLGYQAVPSGNDSALSIPLAMAAGLGEWSRMGLLVTKKYGPRVRICKVFTDMPLASDSFRPFGVVEFCKVCKKCATNCPSQAIPHGDMTTEGPNISSHSGIRKWYVNGERCYDFWEKNRMDCTDCIRVCPFNKLPGLHHDFVRGVIKKTTIFNRFFLWLDSILGYDRRRNPSDFWVHETNFS